MRSPGGRAVVGMHEQGRSPLHRSAGGQDVTAGLGFAAGAAGAAAPPAIAIN